MKPTLNGNAVVIEDDDGIRALITAVLRRAGLHVVAVTNGTDGVAAVRDLDPIVVTIDIRMPGINGIETTRRIRSFSDVFIVMLSAQVTSGDEVASLNGGADVYMAKPFRPRDLQAMVIERLAERYSG